MIFFQNSGFASEKWLVISQTSVGFEIGFSGTL
jgi:hypothetical protein